MYFVAEEFARFFHWKDDGTEVTSGFYFAPGFITSFTGFVEQTPSVVNIRAMVKLEVLVLKRNDLHHLYNEYPLIEKLCRILTEKIYIHLEKHLFGFLNDPPQERYQWLLKEHPEYIRNITLHYLASFPGITAESLSRIRKRTL